MFYNGRGWYCTSEHPQSCAVPARYSGNGLIIQGLLSRDAVCFGKFERSDDGPAGGCHWHCLKLSSHPVEQRLSQFESLCRWPDM